MYNCLKNLILHHQGWTDIINCLGLVTYYTHQYNNPTLIIREDSSDLVNFYFRDKKININYYKFKDINKSSKNIFSQYPDYNHLFHGQWDIHRADNYRNCFIEFNDTFFVESFYKAYNIDYAHRIENFSFTRDLNVEKAVFENFIKKNGKKYILVHEAEDVGLPPYRSILPKVNLHNSTSLFFDYIMVMENARAMYLIDSVWAAFAYQLDAKYKLFRKIPITVNCQRGYKQMFTSPIKLDNWKVI